MFNGVNVTFFFPNSVPAIDLHNLWDLHLDFWSVRGLSLCPERHKIVTPALSYGACVILVLCFLVVWAEWKKKEWKALFLLDLRYFVLRFQECFQHARLVSTQTPLNFFSFAWLVPGPGLRPPCCRDSLGRDPGPGGPWHSSQADSLKEWLLGVSETLAGKKRSSSNYGLANFSHW